MKKATFILTCLTALMLLSFGVQSRVLSNSNDRKIPTHGTVAEIEAADSTARVKNNWLAEYSHPSDYRLTSNTLNGRMEKSQPREKEKVKMQCKRYEQMYAKSISGQSYNQVKLRAVCKAK